MQTYHQKAVLRVQTIIRSFTLKKKKQKNVATKAKKKHFLTNFEKQYFPKPFYFQVLPPPCFMQKNR